MTVVAGIPPVIKIPVPVYMWVLASRRFLIERKKCLEWGRSFFDLRALRCDIYWIPKLSTIALDNVDVAKKVPNVCSSI